VDSRPQARLVGRDPHLRRRAALRERARPPCGRGDRRDSPAGRTSPRTAARKARAVSAPVRRHAERDLRGDHGRRRGARAVGRGAPAERARGRPGVVLEPDGAGGVAVATDSSTSCRRSCCRISRPVRHAPGP
jgi:hypothetical protein